MQKNALQGTGTNYIFNDISSPTTPGIKDFDDLILNDPDLLDIFTSYSCPSRPDLALTASLSGTTVTLTASSGHAYYDFYEKLIGPPESVVQVSSVNNTSPSISVAAHSVSKYVVYAKTGTCFQAASVNGYTIIPPPAKPTTPTGTTPICQGTATSTVQTTATSGASTYAWSIVQQSGTISPGTISGTGTSATITWNPLFSGVALVGVTGVNASSTYGSPSDALSITVNPQPAPVLGSTAICAGSSIALGASGGYSSYSWTVTTTGFSLINATTPAPTLTAPDNDTLFPIGTTEIVAYPNVSVTVTDSNGCSATVTNNSTDRQVAVFRIPRTGAPYHISNVVAK